MSERDGKRQSDRCRRQADLRADPLRIGISTRALVALETEHDVFVGKGVEAYAAMQRAREDTLIDKGAGFEAVARLLALNEPGRAPYVEVILLSRNSPDLSLRAFKSIEHYGLDIKHASFVSGRSLAPYLSAWDIDLFLSSDGVDVHAAAKGGVAAARLGVVPEGKRPFIDGEVRIALDCDAVVVAAESDEIYKRHGLAAFHGHEAERSTVPMSPGPFRNVLRKLVALRQVHSVDGVSKVRIAIVTARSAPAHARVVHTLRAWDTMADEIHFVGGREKAPFLEAFAAHLFFDDQETHVLGASRVVASGHVPGPHDPGSPIIPA